MDDSLLAGDLRKSAAVEGAADAPVSDIVFGFDGPHRVGTICGLACEICRAGAVLYGIDGSLLPDTPLLILAEATEDDWRECVKARGGPDLPAFAPPRYYYFVRAD